MLAEASYDMTAAAYQKQHEADAKIVAIFNIEAVHDGAASALQGRPIYKEQEYIMLMVPGDKDSIVHRRAEEKDKQRFPRQYAAFKNKQSQETSAGTPLGAVTFLNKAQVKELEAFNCFTVENLADMPDTYGRNFREFQSLKANAKSFLEAAKGMAPITALQAENESLKQQLEQNQSALNDLGARFAALEKKVLEKALAD